MASTVGATVAGAAAEERGIDGTAEDAMIDLALRGALLNEEAALLGDVTITVRERRVLLAGVVASDDKRRLVVQTAWRIKGVAEVLDKMQVRSRPIGFWDSTRDGLIASDLRGELMTDGRIKSINYTIDVIDRVVYLMGVAQDEAERQRVVNWARNTDYVRGVIDLTLLRDDPRRVAPNEVVTTTGGGS